MKKGYIISFILGLIIMAGIGVYAITASEVDYKDTTVSDALDDLYDKVTPEVLYTNSNNYSTRSTSVQLDQDITSILVECVDNNKSYYVKLNKGDTAICGYHYQSNNVWYENNRYLLFSSTGALKIEYPRTINLDNGNIVHPSDTVMYVKAIYKAN